MPTIQEFDFSVNFLKALLWQDNKAKNLQAILQAKQDWYLENQTQFWTDWYNNVFNLATANDFGCDVWAIILGFSTALLFPPPTTFRQPWGFDLTNKTNFDGQSNFTGTSQQPITFTTDEKRMILQLRYRQMISRGTVPETNKTLDDIIKPRYGECWMIDGLDMTETMHCNFVIPFKLNLMLENFDLIARPRCVKFILTGL